MLKLVSLSIDLPAIFLISYFVCKMVKDAHSDFPEPRVTSSGCLFCLASSLKLKDNQKQKNSQKIFSLVLQRKKEIVVYFAETLL